MVFFKQSKQVGPSSVHLSSCNTAMKGNVKHSSYRFSLFTDSSRFRRRKSLQENQQNKTRANGRECKNSTISDSLFLFHFHRWKVIAQFCHPITKLHTCRPLAFR
mmetsp:Transcript_12007/g.15170  ORF Transcript_12007/g.15170 Transcript_12007/m.15170 type:complete len:105 (-) Transcript_12007:11-325(-)